jgi:hypothetical protein
MALSAQTIASLCQKIDHNIDFRGKRIFCPKSPKIAIITSTPVGIDQGVLPTGDCS